ncbi:D-3-phosphoglycerate dehydrogenase [Oopsacas minuta]|uniref:D-3-phosphoglycerate dehydrogenase n=1 Tax=Oopsacas minuta TaxID=111878 RepID=A0AAV7K2T4_9METZ|nr:D-3-phosphoglycerate dehydrogenase [Oopsacas minuta]
MDLKLTRVLISDQADPSCKSILEENGIKVDVKTGLSKEELKKAVTEYDGLIVRSATKVTADVINTPGCILRIIGRAGTGVDNIDLDAATNQGIIVMNTPGGNTISAVELTCFMMGCMARSIPKADASMKAGRWDRKLFMGTELMGKTLFIVGLGKIGREVAIRMQSFGMRTIGYDPIIPAEAAAKFGVEVLSWDEMLATADYMTLHTPLLPETRNLINEENISKCKPGIKILNCARGGIIDEDALYRGLVSGHVSGAALDVYDVEPPKNEALFKHENVIATPHLGASTKEAQKRVAREIAEQFVDVVKGRPLVGVVNAPSLVHASSKHLVPYVSLAKKLGVVLASISKDKALEMKLEGETANKYKSLLVSSVLFGILMARGIKDVNMVNAECRAKENKIALTITSCEQSSDKISLAARDITLTGVPCHATDIITNIDGIDCNVSMGRCTLVVEAYTSRIDLLQELSSKMGEKIENINFVKGRVFVGIQGEIQQEHLNSEKIGKFHLITY